MSRLSKNSTYPLDKVYLPRRYRDKLILTERLGVGSYGEVYRCVDKATGYDYALKVCPVMLKHNHKDSGKYLEREKSMLLNDYIIHYIDLDSFLLLFHLLLFLPDLFLSFIFLSSLRIKM